MRRARADRLNAFCRRLLPTLRRQADGERMLRWVEAIVATDQWTSFDRYAETNQTLLQEYEAAGAKAELYEVQTGDDTGTGRWVINEAQDVRKAIAHIVHPVHSVLVDYAQNPWHVARWSHSTPSGGLTGPLAVIDDKEQLEKLRRGALAGKVVLTRLGLRPGKLWSDKGAAVVISDAGVEALPEATPWVSYGWGALPFEEGPSRPVGLALSRKDGEALRELLGRHGSLTLHVEVEVARYIGTHGVVSGLVRGNDDPDDEVWVLAHSMEPGAADNASGVATCLEVAALLEGLIAAGELPRPRRTIRLLNAFECYGFFAYLERTRRLQPPLAGVCIDCVGVRPELCQRRLNWNATIPMSASFVDGLGETILRHTLKLGNAGYRLHLGPFVPTSDTLIGDPKYGFPCPWLNTLRAKAPYYDAYHNSGDTLEVLSSDGLEVTAAAMAGYLYYLADATSDDVTELARTETAKVLRELAAADLGPARARYVLDRHAESLRRLRRWLWGGDRAALLRELSRCEAEVGAAAAPHLGRHRRRSGEGAARVPRRKACLSPTLENTPGPIAQQIRDAKLSPWALFWADGRRSLSDITDALVAETGNKVSLEQVRGYFAAHAELGYVDQFEPEQWVTRSRLVQDLRELGLRAGMDAMVHSSLSSLGHVEGGSETVIEALLQVVGSRGTVLFPSFNHGGLATFNPLASPTSNGAIAQAAWPREDAVRSLHPTHSVCAIGAKAEAYCAGHLEAGVWGQDSPIGRLVHNGGWILCLGVDHTATTAYHVAEISVPCGCLDMFGKVARAVDDKGEVQEVPGLAWRADNCPVSPSRLDGALDDLGLQRHGKVGESEATLVKAIDLWRVRRGHLIDVCPSCPVRPEA